MRLLLLILLFALLCLLDAASTIYLYQNIPSGRELNPYIDPGSFTGILLVPVKFIVYGLFLVCLMMAEKNEKTISAKGGLLSNAALLAYFSLFLIFTKVLAILNNLMPIVGISTPISYFLRFMQNFPGDESLHYSMFWSAMFLLLAPLGLSIVKHIYRPSLENSTQEN